MPAHDHGLTALVLLGCCAVLSSGVNLGLRGGQRPEGECEGLAKFNHLHARPLSPWNQTNGKQAAVPAFSCHVASSAAGAKDSDGSGATCSPVCAEDLDVVVVLGASEWSLEQEDVSQSRRSALDLIKHFALGRARGSLFGFLDVSNGAGKAVRVSPLSDDREALTAALKAWGPLVGGKAVTSVEMQGFEQRPEVLAMLNISRPNVRRTLLVLQPPARQPPASAFSQPSHLGLAQTASDPFKRDKEIMELLVSTCPAVRIDPDLACGRMRWGSGSSDNDEIHPWGAGKSK